MCKKSLISLRVLLAAVGLFLITGAVDAQVTAPADLRLFVGEDYALPSFGRALTFDILVRNVGPGDPEPAVDTMLHAALPPGVSFVSESFGGAVVSGSPATGQDIAWNLGTVDGTNISLGLEVGIGASLSDGTVVPVDFAVSSPSEPAAEALVGNMVVRNIQAGMLPVEVFVEDFSAISEACTSCVTSESDDGMGTSASATGPASIDPLTTAMATARTDTLSVVLSDPNVPEKAGEIVDANSQVVITGIGSAVEAQGGWHGGGCNLFFADSASGDTTLSVDVRLQNPNPFEVGLILDYRASSFAAAGNELAGGSFSTGYPGDVFVEDGVPLAEALSGKHTESSFRRVLVTPEGRTVREVRSESCFPEGSCDPPEDTTVTSPTPQFLVPANGFLLIFFVAVIQGDGGTNIFFDSTTGCVSLIRSGYSRGTFAAKITLLRGDASVGGGVAFLAIAAASPVVLRVTDAQGRRIGFQAAPDVGAPFDPQPSVLAEILGASYSGLDTQPQKIVIPEPNPQSYQIDVLGMESGPFTLTMETLTVDGQLIDSQMVEGMASPNSSDVLNLTVGEGGTLTLEDGPLPDCASLWPIDTVNIIAKGQSPTNNLKVSQDITGNIVGGAAAYGPKAHRIKLCAETPVTVVVSDSTSTGLGPIVTPLSAGISCSSGPGANCTVLSLTATEKYKAESEDGNDTDRVTLIPRP